VRRAKYLSCTPFVVVEFVHQSSATALMSVIVLSVWVEHDVERAEVHPGRELEAVW
jgi:hypothetical protein